MLNTKLFQASHGIDLKRNVMCNWHDHLADRLLPLYDLIAERIRMSDYVRIDETPIPCLEPGVGKTATGYFWVYQHAEHGPLFDWHKSRANTCLDQILIGKNGKPSFNGYLQSDGLRAYRTFIERHLELNIIPVSCLTHIRRKFWEARHDHPRLSRWIIRQIGKIYRIEKRLKKEKAAPLDRQHTRWLETRRHYDHLRKLFHHLEKHRRILPKSKLGKALSYARDQWGHLEPCFMDGQIEFDNNHTEGAIRPTKLGMKNWMFIGRDETGWRSAVIYTFAGQTPSTHDLHGAFVGLATPSQGLAIDVDQTPFEIGSQSGDRGDETFPEDRRINRSEETQKGVGAWDAIGQWRPIF